MEQQYGRIIIYSYFYINLVVKTYGCSEKHQMKKYWLVCLKGFALATLHVYFCTKQTSLVRTNMTFLALNVVMCIAVTVNLSQCIENPKQIQFRPFRYSASFTGITIHQTHSPSKVVCLYSCISQQPMCSFGRYNSATKECQLLGYPKNEMPLTYITDDDWVIFGEVNLVVFVCLMNDIVF